MIQLSKIGYIDRWVTECEPVSALNDNYERERDRFPLTIDRITPYDALQLLSDISLMTYAWITQLDGPLSKDTRDAIIGQMEQLDENINLLRAKALAQWTPSMSGLIYD